MNWIKTKDKLPQKEQRVLFFSKDWHNEPCIGHLDENEKWVDSESPELFLEPEVTHWTPLLNLAPTK